MYRGRSTKLIWRPHKEEYSHSRGWQRVGFKAKVIFVRSNKKAISHAQGLVRFVHVIQWIPKGWFPVSRNFYVRTCVKFTFTNKIEAMHEWWLKNVKVEPRLTSRLKGLCHPTRMRELMKTNLKKTAQLFQVVSEILEGCFYLSKSQPSFDS